MSYIEGRRERVEQKNNEISRDIVNHGGTILASQEFQQAFDETHHVKGSVSDHSMTVCILVARICWLLRKNGIDVNYKALIQAALCHDLGMLSRDDLYHKRTDSWRDHPEYSVNIARELVPDLSRDAEDAIASHMWPVSGDYPRTKQDVILNVADKVATVADWVFFLTGKQIGSDIRENVDRLS